MSRSWGQRAVSERAFEVPPSPMSTSLQMSLGRRARNTPSQSRGLRGLNLSGTSPKFLLGGRGRSLKQQQLPGQSTMKRMQSLFTSSSEDSSSSSSEDEGQETTARRHTLDVVDALSVVPASPLQPARAQSQPMQPGSASMPDELSRAQSFVPPFSPFKEGSLLEQLHTMTNAGAAGGGSGVATANDAMESSAQTDLRRDESQGTHSSLPDLAPPPLVERGSGGSACLANPSARRGHSPPPQQLQTIRSQQRLDPDMDLEYQQQRTPTHSSLGSIRCLPDNRAGQVPDVSLREYHVVNAHGGTRLAVPAPMSADWASRQLELAELGQNSTLPGTSRHARSINLQSAHHHEDERAAEATLISYDNQVPMSYATPVGLLVAGAVVLGIMYLS